MTELQQAIHNKLSEILDVNVPNGWVELENGTIKLRIWHLHQLLTAIKKNNPKQLVIFNLQEDLFYITDLTLYPHSNNIPCVFSKSVLEQEDETLQKISEIL